MSGALDSGMDIVIELSPDYILRIIRKRMTENDQGCFEAEDVPIPNPLIEGEQLFVTVRRAQLVLEDMSFEQTPFGPVFMRLNIRLLYAQVHRDAKRGANQEPVELWVNESEWKSLDELDGVLHSFRTDPLQLLISADSDQVVLRVDVPSYFPPDWGESIEFPVNFLNQTQSFQDEAGVEQVVTLLAVTVNSVPEIKVVEAGHLAIGLDVQLSQDEDLMILGLGVPRDVDPVVAGPEDLVPHGCGLPSQPATDPLAFQTEFTESFLAGSDLAVALDAHIVDAILRGLPSARMNNEGEETEDCEHAKALRSMCLFLDPPLQDDVIQVHGSGEAFICIPDLIPQIGNGDGYYEVDFTATITSLSLDGRRMQARYNVTDLRVPDLGPMGSSDLVDLGLALAGEDNPRDELSLDDVRTRFGETDDPAGRITIEEVRVQSDGLVFRGSSDVRPKQRSILVTDLLLFATGCQRAGQPVTRRFEIRNTGNADLHLCPLGIRRHSDGDVDDADLFIVTSPDELLDNGAGLTLQPNERINVDIECRGDPDGAYIALLDIPNDAQEKSVTLNANFLPVTLGPIAEELNFGHIEYEWSGCDRPPDRSAVLDLEITNEGPGHMQICSIELSDDVQNVFSASNPGVFATGTAIISVTFSGIWGESREYDGTMRIVTNGGEERLIHLIGQVTTHEDDPWGVFSHRGFDGDRGCFDADSDRVQDTGGRILDVPEVEQLLPILGGEDCCPPPLAPACRCVDLWEIAFSDVQPDVMLQVEDSVGQPIATNFAQSSTRILVMPIKEGNGYALRAKIPRSLTSAQSSRVIMRRWIAQQDGLYTSSQHLSDVAVVGEYAYAVGPQSMEVISLSDLEQPNQVALTREPAGASSVAVMGKHLLVAKDRLQVYGLENPQRPKLAGNLTLSSTIKTLLTARTGHQPAWLAYGAGQRLHILDLSDFKHPKELTNVTTRVQATRVLQHGKRLYLLGKNGLEVFDLSRPDTPKTIGFLPTQQEIQNALLTKSFALLVYDSRIVDMVDISEPSRPQVAGGWRLEGWMSEYVPLTGRFPRYQDHFLMLRGDQLGFRVMRIRRNKVDQEKLRQWRGLTRA